jgi:hypothetical protein
MPKTQQATFIDIKRLSHDVSNLAAFVQNDFNRLLADGHSTTAEISKSAEDAAFRFDRCLEKLTNLKDEVITVLSNFSSGDQHV